MKKIYLSFPSGTSLSPMTKLISPLCWKVLREIAQLNPVFLYTEVIWLMFAFYKLLSPGWLMLI